MCNTTIIRIAACAAAAGLAVGCCSVVKPGYDTLIAHRGESVDAPENTLPAYKTAVERGFGFECDIYLSKDGRVFTFHDRNLKRTTGGANTNNCTDVTWDVIFSNAFPAKSHLLHFQRPVTAELCYNPSLTESE